MNPVLDQIDQGTTDERELILLQMDQKQIETLESEFAANIPQEEEEQVADELKDFQNTKDGGKSISDLEGNLKNVEL